MIWVSENELTFIYKIIGNIRNTLNKNNDLLHFMRYLIDLTGIIEPVESSEVFSIIVELVLLDLETLLPMHLGNEKAISIAFGE